MARQDVSAGAPLMPPSPDTPLRELAPGAMAKLTPVERAKKLKHAKKGVPNMAALITPASVLGR